jgi:hypothetical protein
MPKGECTPDPGPGAWAFFDPVANWSYARFVSDRPPVVDIRIRMSRRFVFWTVTVLVLVFIVLPFVWLMLQTLGGTSTKS